MDEKKEHLTPDEEAFLSALGEAARRDRAEEGERFDDSLRRLAAGELSDGELAALRAEAEDAETSEERRLDLEAFRPLGRGFQDRLLETLQERTARSRGAAPPPPPVDFSAWRRRGATARPWLAAAAVLVLAVAGYWLARDLWRSPSPEPVFELADYTHELEGQLRDQRSGEPGEVDDEAAPSFALGNRFRLVLRPEREVAETPEMQFLLAPRGGEPAPWDIAASTERSGGSVKIEGLLGEELPIEPGRFTFVFLYGRPGALPGAPDLAELGEGGRDWRAVLIPFEVVAGDGQAGLPLEVLYAGCHAVTPGPVCTPRHKLVLWVRSSDDAQIELRLDGRHLALEGQGVDGGRRYAMPIAKQEGVVEVVAMTAGRETRFVLSLAPSGEPEWLRRAHGLAYQGELETARELLLAGYDDAPDNLRGPVAALLARLPDPEGEAMAWLERSFEHNRQHGRWLGVTKDLGMLQYFDVQDRHFSRLRRRLDALAAELAEAWEELPGEAVFQFAYSRGILENDVGNYRAALDALGSAAELAHRLGLLEKEALAETKRAIVLQRLGRGEEAVAVFRRVDDPRFADVLTPCLRAELYNNHAWVLILSGGALGDPLPLLARARRLVDDQGCDAPPLLDLALNRALAHEQRGELWETRAALAEAEPLIEKGNPLHRLWLEELEGRLALAESRGREALEHYRAVEALAETAFEPWASWRAKVRQAAAHELLGGIGEALAAYDEAEDLLDDQSLQVPLDAGRESLVADRAAGTRHHLDLLLRLGNVVRAFDVARRSRSRVLRSIRQGHRLAHLSPAEQATWDLEVARYLELRSQIESESAEDWQLTRERLAEVRERRADRRAEALAALDRAFRVLEPGPAGDSLPPLEGGELVLAYHPLPEGWVAFAARPGQVEHHRFALESGALDDPSELSRHLLEPFRQVLDESEQVRVLTHDALREVDFHALPWEGDVLLAARPVVYGLDLPASGPAPADAAERQPIRRALVVGDPRGDLPAARHEAEAVATALAGSGRGREPAEVLRLDDWQATLPEVRRRLTEVDLLHLAGHGIAAGRFGWESALLLADGARLTLGDVLALEHAPTRVVLSSCESARDAATSIPSLGLAQAFLVAGSEQVIAALRPVGDGETARLFEYLYGDGSGTDLAERLRAAQLAWRAQDPAADWASFRVLEP